MATLRSIAEMLGADCNKLRGRAGEPGRQLVQYLVRHKAGPYNISWLLWL